MRNMERSTECGEPPVSSEFGTEFYRERTADVE